MTQKERTLIRDTIEEFERISKIPELSETDKADLESRIDCLKWVLCECYELD